jgi:hypothetical protein
LGGGEFFSEISSDFFAEKLYEKSAPGLPNFYKIVNFGQKKFKIILCSHVLHRQKSAQKQPIHRYILNDNNVNSKVVGLAPGIDPTIVHYNAPSSLCSTF